jgi:hypothetical protein
LIGKSEDKGPLGRYGFGHKDIKMDLKEIRWEVVDWIHLGQGTVQCLALVNTVTNFQTIQTADNLLSSWATLSVSRRTLLHGGRCQSMSRSISLWVRRCTYMLFVNGVGYEYLDFRISQRWLWTVRSYGFLRRAVWRQPDISKAHIACVLNILSQARNQQK